MSTSKGRLVLRVEALYTAPEVRGQGVGGDLLTSYIYVMCARLYGRHSARHRAEKALQAASEA